MATLAEIESKAMELTDTERATLATHLLVSLPESMDYDAEGIAEALRREKEMEENAQNVITLEQLKQSVGR